MPYKCPKLFQSEFSTDCDLVQSSVIFQHSHISSLPSSSFLRILSRVPVTTIQCHPVAAYVFFLVFPSLPFSVIQYLLTYSFSCSRHFHLISSSSCIRIFSRVPVTSIQCHPVAAYVFFLVFPSLPFNFIQ
jgi:hypothetical protein